MGYNIEASADSHLIEIHRVDGLHVGTTIEVELTSESVSELKLETRKHNDPNVRNVHADRSTIDWFCWDWPKVSKRLVSGTTLELLDQKYVAPLRKAKPTPEWSVIHPEGFDAVYWTFENMPLLTCNGLRIAEPYNQVLQDAKFRWPAEAELKCPNIAVFDGAANLPLTTQRYDLSQEDLPFIDELTRDVFLSFIAHALVCGPVSRGEAHSTNRRDIYHPLWLDPFSRNSKLWSKLDSLSKGRLRWCTTPRAVIPLDPWLYSLLRPESCIAYGVLQRPGAFGLHSIQNLESAPLVSKPHNHAVLRWDERLDTSTGKPFDFLTQLADNGISALGNKMIRCQVMASVSHSACTAAAVTSRVRQSNQTGFFENWDLLPTPSGSQRLRFGTKTGTPSTPLDDWLTEMELTILRNGIAEDIIECLYVAQIDTKAGDVTPASIIARIWNECLGRKTILFDPAARQALIEHGRQHLELNRHIDAWEEMKRHEAKRRESVRKLLGS